MLLDNGAGVAHDHGCGVVVGAVNQNLDRRAFAFQDVALEIIADFENDLDLAAVKQPVDLFLRGEPRNEHKIAGGDKAVNQGAGIFCPVIVEHGQRDFADIKINGKAENKEQKRRQHEEQHEGDGIALDLDQLLAHDNVNSAKHAAPTRCWWFWTKTQTRLQ